jgi:hypothetical protein
MAHSHIIDPIRHLIEQLENIRNPFYPPKNRWIGVFLFDDRSPETIRKAPAGNKAPRLRQNRF